MTANQLYKQSNTTLSFKDWLEREKNKGKFIANSLLEDVVKPYSETEKLNESNFKDNMPKYVLFFGILLVTGALIYKLRK